MLLAVTEMNTRRDIDRLVEGLRQATGEQVQCPKRHSMN